MNLKSLFGQPLPEFGVSEFLQMPDRSIGRKKQEIKKEKKKKNYQILLTKINISNQ